MNSSELKALVSLLDDSDNEVSAHVENQIRALGDDIIPFLEKQWEESGFDPILQKKIEELIHDLQYNNLLSKLKKWKKEGAEDLLEGLWLIATYQYPELSLDNLKQEINKIYFEVWLQMRDETHPEDNIRILNQVFFDKYKFSPNTKNFHSPSNSMVNQVLELKRGNPISLCSIYLLVAQKLNLPVFGVNLPSLFILTYESKNTQFYINVFNKGLIFSKKDIDSYLKQMNIAPQPMFYEPCSNLEIIKRTLVNLVVSFTKNSDNQKSKEVNILLDGLKEEE
jgi:regulator of sirC expression with transglutaminase-like and TPR domain